jgi:hypothetical protein
MAHPLKVLTWTKKFAAAYFFVHVIEDQNSEPCVGAAAETAAIKPEFLRHPASSPGTGRNGEKPHRNLDS